MQFSLDRFYRINRRAFIWVALFALIYILRDFFALIFLTFILVSFTLPVINWVQTKTNLPRRLIISVLYFCICAGVTGMIYYIVPKIGKEATSGLTEQLEPERLNATIERTKAQIIDKYPGLSGILNSYTGKDGSLENSLSGTSLTTETLSTAKSTSEALSTPKYVNYEDYLIQAKSQLQSVLKNTAYIAFFTVSTIYLSLLFAFLIVFDLARLREEIRKFEKSRLHDFYEQSAEPVVKFASVIANTFRAQAVIAFVNTLLTLIGFWILGVPKLVILTVIVFFFSFIPVLGVFISTAPAVLIAMNHGGLIAGVHIIIFVIVIHMIEAYILNPFIYGQHLKLNPVLVLIILYVGHHFFGLWGMLLGVPVAYYFIHYVFKVPGDETEIESNKTLTLDSEKHYNSGSRNLREESKSDTN